MNCEAIYGCAQSQARKIRNQTCTRWEFHPKRCQRYASVRGMRASVLRAFAQQLARERASLHPTGSQHQRCPAGWKSSRVSGLALLGNAYNASAHMVIERARMSWSSGSTPLQRHCPTP
jgi:hypothetical protein